MSAKRIIFTPSERTLALISEYMNKHNITNKSIAINKLVESPINEATEETTGIIIACPLRILPFPIDRPIMTLRLPIDSSVCKSCSKKPCDSWLHIESWSKTNSYVKRRR